MTSSETLLSNRRIIFTALIGILITAALFFFTEPLLAGFSGIIFGTLVLGLVISEDAARNRRPIILARLSDSHREIVLENDGTMAAENIQVTVAGMDEKWNIPTIQPEESHQIELPSLVTCITVEIIYESRENQVKRKTVTLGSPETERDPFKPVFPMFSWKEKK